MTILSSCCIILLKLQFGECVLELKSLSLQPPFGGRFSENVEGVHHRKSLPCMSIVQSVAGSYDIALGGGSYCSTGQGGVFFAPSDVQQDIVHHNCSDGFMQAQWVMLYCTVNGKYRFEDIFECPMILPQQYSERINKDIQCVLDGDLGTKYAAGYDLIQILIDNATEKPVPDVIEEAIRQYVFAHFSENIKSQDIANFLHVSVAQVYRYTNRFFATSPANYINRVRLQNALKLLHDPSVQIKQAAVASGFTDLAYFSRLFKATFGDSPRSYLKNFYV